MPNLIFRRSFSYWLGLVLACGRLGSLELHSRRPNVKRVCAGLMAEAGRGSIVNICSQMEMISPNFYLYEGGPPPVPPDYFFHKGGMINLTRYMAAQYDPCDVRVNVVSPGGIRKLGKPPSAAFLKRYGKMTMLGRMAEIREIGGSVVFLLSDAAAYITGANLSLDGGYTAE